MKPPETESPRNKVQNARKAIAETVKSFFPPREKCKCGCHEKPKEQPK